MPCRGWECAAHAEGASGARIRQYWRIEFLAALNGVRLSEKGDAGRDQTMCGSHSDHEAMSEPRGLYKSAFSNRRCQCTAQIGDSRVTALNLKSIMPPDPAMSSAE